MSEELKPCPFCGEKAKRITTPSSGITGQLVRPDSGSYFIQCEHCFAKSGRAESIKDAYASWNMRYDEEDDEVKSKDAIPLSLVLISAPLELWMEKMRKEKDNDSR